MQYRHDDDPVLLDAEIDAERKAPPECSAGIAVNRGIDRWLFSDEMKRVERFIQKLMSEPRALPFIPARGGGDVLVRLFPEPDHAGHNLLLISATTSSAGRPTLRSDS